MTAEGQNFIVFGGDSRILNVTVVDVLEAAVDITDAELQFKIYQLGNTQSAMVEKSVGEGVTITDGPAGEFQVVLNPIDTNVNAIGEYPYDCRLIDPSGHVSTIMTGRMVLK